MAKKKSTKSEKKEKTKTKAKEKEVDKTSKETEKKTSSKKTKSKSKKEDTTQKEEEQKSLKSEDKVEDKEPEEKPKKATKRKKSKIEIKLFNRWSFNDVEVHDMSLVNYINLRPIIIPHSGGKHEHKRFWKTEHVSIIERFINKILAPGLVKRRIRGRGSSYNSGKKQKVMKIIENAFILIEKKTNQNPIQVLVDAICNAAPREETTRISLGGISYQIAVDIAPQRRVDLGIRLLVQAAIASTYNNLKTIDENFCDEIILAAREDPNSKAIRRRDEIERIALSAR
ncbi:MAG: 30S ribosomal protein S7 [Promethearchaeota archaeon]